MRKVTAIILCLCMLLSILAGCTNDNKTDGGDPKQSGQQENSNGGGTPNLNVGNVKASDVLAIAKKYYDAHSGVLSGDLKSEFTADAGSVSFDGKSKDDEKAEELCNTAVLIAVFGGHGDYAVACAAAAVGHSSGYARSAGTLASMLYEAGFIKDSNRLNDAKKLAEYAISLDKNDIDFYITLSLIQQDLNDNSGAMKAIDAALVVDKKNNTALTIKINILAKTGGSADDAKKVIKELEENDGELGKRDRKQADDAKKIDDPKEGDSKETALRKLNAVYTLKPITPADMLETLFPEQAKTLREKIMTVSEEDKKLGLPDFPLKLVNDLDAFCAGGYVQYLQWLTEQRMESIKIRNSLSSISTPGIPSSGETAADYMREYNKQVVRAATENFLNFNWDLWIDVLDVLHQQEELLAPKVQEYLRAAEEEVNAGVHPDIARLRYAVRCNAAVRQSVNVAKSALNHWYTEVRREGERLWEEMLPYARCTAEPGAEISRLYGYVYDFAAPDAVSQIVGLTIHYTPGAEVQLEEIQKAIEEAIAEATRAQKPGKPDVLEGFAITASLGPFGFKLSANGVEVEVVAGLAMRVAYNPTTGHGEFGMGGGYKAKVGAAAAQMGVEGKVYMNFVFDIRKNEVTDIYYSAEAKGRFVGFEGGGQARISAFGKGAALSTSAKQQFGDVISIEHEKEILRTK